MKSFLLFLFLVPCFSGSAQVINDINATPRTVGAFHAIEVSDVFQVELSQGTETALAVSAENKEDIPLIKTEVKNGVLHISFEKKNKWWPNNRKLRAYVSVKELDGIGLSGASRLRIQGTLRAAKMQLDLSGASDLEGRLEVQGRVEADLSGASQLDIEGSAGDMDLELSGASKVEAEDFTVNTCNIEASGASKVEIRIEKELSVEASGASKISYKGGANIRNIQTSGASKVSKSD